jgi:hypothetical protein
MSYILYISYKDTCWKEKIPIWPLTTIQEIYDELKRTGVYRDHWDLFHSDIGIFPFEENSPLFPTIEAVQTIVNSLSVGQLKYIMRGKSQRASYYCALKRIA